MKKLLAAATLVCVVLVVAAASSASTNRTANAVRAGDTPGIAYGVADDSSKYAADGGSWFYGELKGAGLTENRWTLSWDPANPTAIEELAFLQRAAPVAQANGVKVVLVLQSIKGSQHDPNQFCSWASTVVQTVKQWGITNFIVWNEPNTRLFWTPQKDGSGNDVAASAYEQLLATCYDAIKQANPDATVIGMGLSPRASTPDSNEPLVFLRDVGKAYRASGRNAPLMDQLAIHPYPNPNSPTDSPDVGYQVPNRFGIPNLDRVKQAVYDAFNGTAQPTTVSGTTSRRLQGGAVHVAFNAPLTFRIDEIGWQVDTSSLPQYFGQENVKTVTDAVQAQYLNRMVTKYFACDPTVTDVMLFLLEDEKYRAGKDENGNVVGGGWQSGLITYGGPGVSQPRSAYSQMAQLAGAGRSACGGRQIAWRPGSSGQTGTGGGGTAALSATLGDPDGILDSTTAAEFQQALDAFAKQQTSLPPLSDSTKILLSRLYSAALNRLLAESGPAAQDMTATAMVASCLPSCDVSTVLHSASSKVARFVAAAKAGPRILASGTASVKKGSLIKLRVKSKVRATAGSYFLVVVLNGKTDTTKKFGFAVQLRSVAHKAKAKAKHKANANKAKLKVKKHK